MIKHYFILFVYLMPWSVYANTSYTLGVANYDSVMSIATQWNPMLAWIQQKTGVELKLVMGLTPDETFQRLQKGGYDFFVGYPMLKVASSELNYFPIVKPLKQTSQSAIVVLTHSSVHQLSELQSLPILATSESNFLAHVLPLGYLYSVGVFPKIETENNMGSLALSFKQGKALAAGVNWPIFQKKMTQESQSYRVLWMSPIIPGLPVGASNKVPKSVVELVQSAMIQMHQEQEGQKVLKQINERMGLDYSGWVLATEDDYVFARHIYQVYAAGEDKISGGLKP